MRWPPSSGTKGPSLYNHVDSLDDLRRTVRMRVIDDIIEMLNTVGDGPHPRRRGAGDGQRLPQLRPPPPGPVLGVHPDAAAAATIPSTPRPRRAAAAPVIAVLASYGLDGEDAFYAALEFWSAMHGFVLLEMTGVMDDIDTDAVFSDMVLRLAAGMEHRSVACDLRSGA